MEKIVVNLDKEHNFGVFGATNGPRPTKKENKGEKIYKDLDFSCSRLHDTGIISFHRYVDIDKIFKNFNKDENNLKNYYFKDTDRYIEKLNSMGIKIIFRLGYSAVAGKNYKNKVPKDIDKWSRVAYTIAKHYEGKVEYFEIWNEPDLKIFFEGTNEEFFEIYHKTSLLIKNNVKNAKVGGCAFAIATGDMAKSFLQYVKNNNLPLDFYSYHRYHHIPSEFKKLGFEVREMLDSFGFNNTITILDEWNFNINFSEQLKASYKVMPTKQGALFVLSSLIEIAKAPIDINTYYDFEINYMLFIYNGIVRLSPFFTLKTTETYDIYKLFNILKKTGKYLETEATTPGIYAISSKTKDALYLLVSNYRFIDQKDFEVQIDLNGLKYKNVEVIFNNKTTLYDKLDIIDLKNEEYKLLKFNI